MCVCVVDCFCCDCGGFACLSSHAGDNALAFVCHQFFLIVEKFEVKHCFCEERGVLRDSF